MTAIGTAERPHAGAGCEPCPDRSGASAWARLAVVIPLLLAAGLGVAQLLVGDGLTGFVNQDDGTYLAQSVLLVHGALPYKDFVAVEPPGIMVVLSPIAALAHLTGTTTAMALGRIMTLLVELASVALVGRILRHRGPLAQFVGMSALAIDPTALGTAQTIFLEPWAVLFSLIGMNFAFDGDGPGSRRRTFVGAVFIGVAGSFKVFAVFPALVLLAITLHRRRANTVAVLGGLAAGFGAVTAPFALAAPSAFLHEAVIDQVVRVAPFRTPMFFRVSSADGLRGLGLTDEAQVVIAVGIAIALLVGMLYRWRTTGLTSLEGFSAWSTAALTAAFLWAAVFYFHYGAFLAPFYAIVLATVLPGLCRGRRCGVAVTAALVLMLSLVVSSDVNGIAHQADARPFGPLAAIPAGACVETDDVAYLVLSNRFADVPGCPLVPDAFGTTLALGHGKVAASLELGHPTAEVAAWERLLTPARYIVLSEWYRVELPVTPAFVHWLHARYRTVATLPDHYGWLLERRS